MKRRSDRRRRGLWGALVFVAMLFWGLPGWRYALAQSSACGPNVINSTATNTTSTTHHTTVTNVTLPNAQAYSTEIQGRLASSPALVYDQTFALPFSDPTVQAAVDDARAAILSAAGHTVPIAGPTLVSSSSSTGAAVFVGNQTVGTNTTVTNVLTIGPGTVLFCDDQGQSFFIAAGNTNIDTNTHTETFVNAQYQATTTNDAVYELVGQDLAAVAVPVLSGFGLTALAFLLAAVGAYVVRRGIS